MDDRTLLGLAAKAAGFGAQNKPENPHCWTESKYLRGSGKCGALWNYVEWGNEAELWNPLTDDGDALRLAVKLKIELGYLMGNSVWAKEWSSSAVFKESNERKHGNQDPYAATRRAIVRAAAAIGKEMK